ncbi:PAS and ANTAR domain-containing protein [Nocardia araoensis]|uniref:PAS and ANTAR domain-containing protein n=1 Tax=Nocardia araoensis TaxID=228600 RepID=UPI000584701C
MARVGDGNGSDSTGASHGDAREVESPQRVGSFRFWFDDQRWEWSDEVAELYGYTPGQVQPTTDLVLSHNHPADRAAVADALATAVRDHGAFCSRHRIIDTAGRVRHVLVVADHIFDGTGAVVGTSGYFVDLTAAVDEQRREALDETLPEVVEARAAIEQAKGMLMLAYGLNAEQAFQVLRWRSQETNTKLRVLAAKLVTVAAAGGGGPVQLRTQLDHLLLTIHEYPD